MFILRWSFCCHEKRSVIDGSDPINLPFSYFHLDLVFSSGFLVTLAGILSVHLSLRTGFLLIFYFYFSSLSHCGYRRIFLSQWLGVLISRGVSFMIERHIFHMILVEFTNGIVVIATCVILPKKLIGNP